MMKLARGLVFLGAFVVTSAAAGGAAYAGGCPSCTTSADCGGAFCVLWDQSPGCGAISQICCPGQGCAVDNGCPSCVASGKCTIVDGPDTCPQATTSSSSTAASTSTGAATTTTGATGATGSTGPGGATTGATGSGGADGSGGAGSDGGTQGGGCGCRVEGAGAAPWGVAAGLAALVALVARRRRPSPRR